MESNKPAGEAAPPAQKPFVLRVSIPSRNTNKAMMVQPADTVGTIKAQLEEKLGQVLDDEGNGGFWNFGLLDPPKNGKNGKFLDERREIGEYKLDADVVLEFRDKHRLLPPGLDVASIAAANKKLQKRFAEDVQRGYTEKVKEYGSKYMDPNFFLDDGNTPMALAVMNDDRAMILTLVEIGAFVDFRVRDAWKTPLHLAAAAQKTMALATLIAFGAPINSRDVAGQTPLMCAASTGQFDAARMLLEAQADPSLRDANQRVALHLACMKSHEQLVRLLIDFGTEMNVTNNVGNTPLHVAASASSVECVRWLLVRGASRTMVNRSGHTALQVATIANLNTVVELIQTFTDDETVPPPPKPRWDILSAHGPATLFKGGNTHSPTAGSPSFSADGPSGVPGGSLSQAPTLLTLSGTADGTAPIPRHSMTDAASIVVSVEDAQGAQSAGEPETKRRRVLAIPPPPTTPRPEEKNALEGESLASLIQSDKVDSNQALALHASSLELQESCAPQSVESLAPAPEAAESQTGNETPLKTSNESVGAGGKNKRKNKNRRRKSVSQSSVRNETPQSTRESLATDSDRIAQLIAERDELQQRYNAQCQELQDERALRAAAETEAANAKEELETMRTTFELLRVQRQSLQAPPPLECPSGDIQTGSSNSINHDVALNQEVASNKENEVDGQLLKRTASSLPSSSVRDDSVAF